MEREAERVKQIREFYEDIDNTDLNELIVIKEANPSRLYY